MTGAPPRPGAEAVKIHLAAPLFTEVYGLRTDPRVTQQPDEPISAC